MSEENSSPVESGPSTFDSVADAVAELERRETVRAEQRAADKAAKAAPAPEATVEDQPSDQPLPTEEEESTDPPLPEEEGSDESEEVATEAEDPAEQQETSVVSLDGKEIEIPKGTPRALVEGIKKLEADFRADYTRKTQEAAQVKSQAEAVNQQATQTLQQLQQVQATLVQFYQAAIGEPPSPELIHTDPQTYLLQREMHSQRVQQYQQLLQQGQGLTAQQQQAMEQAKAQYLQEQTQKLMKAVPEFVDPAKRAEFTSRITKAAESYGVTPQELANVTDHRMLLMLRDLARLQGREQAAGTVKQKLANVPPKVNKPGNASQDSGRSQKAAQAKQQFMRSGKSMRDVARYLAQTEN